MARNATRAHVVSVLCLTASVALAQGSAPTREFVSERWGFRIALPTEWLVDFAGPALAGCDIRQKRTITVRPAWLASRRIADPADIDRIEVEFTSQPFDSLARHHGFVLADTSWSKERGFGARSVWTYGTDSAAVFASEGWRAIEGFAIERVDHPHPAPGEPAFDFDNTFLSVAQFQLNRDCALVLSTHIISHVSPDESFTNVWRSVRLKHQPRRSAP